ncbi:MAG TPA: hypothetical protein VFV58_07860 [Blastocatellia bacterium]|jgi:hypothetical protein|nr:hypothetical protein [Blastocatellia bacterium]
MPAYESNPFSPPAPVARATLRNSESGATLTDVPLLIDSGADVTLLPKASVDFLGIPVSANSGYELTSFDGSASISQSIRAELIFQRKIFRGEFLLTDQEVGFLGRDVINHLSILLDGPRLIEACAN